jgi:arsenate reductase
MTCPGADAGQRERVLFLCNHNSARSRMAEALLRHHGGHRFKACSAGLEPAPDVHPLTRLVLQEAGIDARTLRAKGIHEFLGKASVRYAIIVCEQTNQSCPRLYPFARQTLFWPFEDPVGAVGSSQVQLIAFRRTRDQIAERVRHFILEGG